MRGENEPFINLKWQFSGNKSFLIFVGQGDNRLMESESLECWASV